MFGIFCEHCGCLIPLGIIAAEETFRRYRCKHCGFEGTIKEAMVSRNLEQWQSLEKRYNEVRIAPIQSLKERMREFANAGIPFPAPYMSPAFGSNLPDFFKNKVSTIKERKENNKMNLPEVRIEIRIVENGFRVMVGCKELVFKTPKEIADALELYVKDPDAAEKKYCKLG